MLLSCGDHSFGAVSFESAVHLVSLLELDAVDVVVFGAGAHVSTEDVLRDGAGVVERVLTATERAGIGVADLFAVPGGLDFARLAANHPDDAARAEARQLFHVLLAIAEGLGLSGLSLVPGIRWEGEAFGDTMTRTARELSWRVAAAADRGMAFSIEAHVGAVVDTPAGVGELLALVPELQLTLDYSHFMYHGGPQAQMDALIPFARHYHARGAAPGRPQVTMGANRIDFAQVIAAMRSDGYPGGICLEYVNIDWEHCNEVDVLTETRALRQALLMEIDRPVPALVGGAR